MKGLNNNNWHVKKMDAFWWPKCKEIHKMGWNRVYEVHSDTGEHRLLCLQSSIIKVKKYTFFHHKNYLDYNTLNYVSLTT